MKCTSLGLLTSADFKISFSRKLEENYDHFFLHFCSFHIFCKIPDITSNDINYFAGLLCDIALDRSHMFAIETAKPSGRVLHHRVKPLPLIWLKFPEYYSLKNTVHVDDVSSNFTLNPGNGIKIKPFKSGPTEKYYDRELVVLAKYLVMIKDVKDVTKIRLRVRSHG